MRLLWCVIDLEGLMLSIYEINVRAKCVLYIISNGCIIDYCVILLLLVILCQTNINVNWWGLLCVFEDMVTSIVILNDMQLLWLLLLNYYWIKDM